MAGVLSERGIHPSNSEGKYPSQDSVELLEIHHNRFRKMLRFSLAYRNPVFRPKPVNMERPDEKLLKHPEAIAIVMFTNTEGIVRVNDFTIPFKTDPKLICTTYKYFDGVKIVPVAEINVDHPYFYYKGDLGGAENAILIPKFPNSNSIPLIYPLLSTDRVVDPHSNTQIYPLEANS